MRMTSCRTVAHLTADDLKGLGIALVGHRRRLLEAIAALRLERRRPVIPFSRRPTRLQLEREPRLV